MDNQTFKKMGYALIDWIADYFTGVENYPVMSPVSPGDIKNQLPDAPPIDGEGLEKIFSDFKEILLEYYPGAKLFKAY